MQFAPRTIQKGQDPRQFALVAQGGGAGPLHAAEVGALVRYT